MSKNTNTDLYLMKLEMAKVTKKTYRKEYYQKNRAKMIQQSKDYFNKHYKKSLTRNLTYRAKLNAETLDHATNHNKRWSGDELAYIQEYYLTKTAQEMALYLGRSLRSVQNQMYLMRLQKNQKLDVTA